MDLSQRALQTNGKLFFSDSFLKLVTIKKIVALGLCKRCGGRHFCWSTRVLVIDTSMESSSRILQLGNPKI